MPSRRVRAVAWVLLIPIFQSAAPAADEHAVAASHLTAASHVPAASRTGPQASLEAQVDAIFAGRVTGATPGCAVGVARQGRLVLARGYGLANLEHGVPITPQTRFRIASVSKHFTAMAILLLQEEGLLSLTDDIRRFLPEHPEYGHIVTISDLLHHASGLPDNGDVALEWEPAPDYFLPWAAGDDFFEEGLAYYFVPLREYLAMLRSVGELKFRPGTRYQYNNAGYVLLSIIVERASGRTLRQFAEEHMFGPLGMTRTFFNDRALEVVPGRADGYHRTPDGTWLKWMTDMNNVGDGGVFTTIEDFFLWDRNFYRNRLGRGDPALIDSLTAPNDDLEYPDSMLERGAVTAKGLLIAETDAGTLEWSNGGWVAFTASARRIRERQLSTFVFCNSRAVIAPGIASRILELYLGE